jgi:hypothetical protein
MRLSIAIGAKRELQEDMDVVVFDKMVSPFEYWLRDKIACEVVNKQIEREENAKQKPGQQ